MTNLEKENLDIDFIIMRDKVIKNLFDYDKFYSLHDISCIKELVNKLYDLLEK